MCAPRGFERRRWQLCLGGSSSLATSQRQHTLCITDSLENRGGRWTKDRTVAWNPTTMRTPLRNDTLLITNVINHWSADELNREIGLMSVLTQTASDMRWILTMLLGGKWNIGQVRGRTTSAKWWSG